MVACGYFLVLSVKAMLLHTGLVWSHTKCFFPPEHLRFLNNNKVKGAGNSFMLLSRIMQMRKKGCCFSIYVGLPMWFDKFLAQNTDLLFCLLFQANMFFWQIKLAELLKYNRWVIVMHFITHRICQHSLPSQKTHYSQHFIESHYSSTVFIKQWNGDI